MTMEMGFYGNPMGMGTDDKIGNGNGNGKKWETTCMGMGMALIPIKINLHRSATGFDDNPVLHKKNNN